MLDDDRLFLRQEVQLLMGILPAIPTIPTVLLYENAFWLQWQRLYRNGIMGILLMNMQMTEIKAALLKVLANIPYFPDALSKEAIMGHQDLPTLFGILQKKKCLWPNYYCKVGTT